MGDCLSVVLHDWIGAHEPEDPLRSGDHELGGKKHYNSGSKSHSVRCEWPYYALEFDKSPLYNHGEIARETHQKPRLGVYDP